MNSSMDRRTFLTGAGLLTLASTLSGCAAFLRTPPKNIEGKLCPHLPGGEGIDVWMDIDPSHPKIDNKGVYSETDDLLSLLFYLKNEDYYTKKGVRLRGISLIHGNNDSVKGAYASLEHMLHTIGRMDVLDNVVRGASHPQDEEGAMRAAEKIEQSLDPSRRTILLSQGPATNIAQLSQEAYKSIDNVVVMWGYERLGKPLGHDFDFLGAIDYYNLMKDRKSAQEVLKKAKSIHNWTSHLAIPFGEKEIQQLQDPYIKKLVSLRVDAHKQQFGVQGAYLWDLFFNVYLTSMINENPLFTCVKQPATIAHAGFPALYHNSNGTPLSHVYRINDVLQYKKILISGLNGALGK